MKMKIYGDGRSGNCDKVRLVADYLRHPYDWVEVDILRDGTRTAEFLAMNPQGQVPVLALPDGRSLAQSGAIMRYLANGTQLLPNDQWTRGRIDEWMFWEAGNHEFFVAGCIAHMTFLGKTRETRDPMRIERGNRALDILDDHLGRTDWLAGDAMTIADVAILVHTRQAPLGGFDLAPRANVRAWVARCERELGMDALQA